MRNESSSQNDDFIVNEGTYYLLFPYNIEDDPNNFIKQG